MSSAFGSGYFRFDVNGNIFYGVNRPDISMLICILIYTDVSANRYFYQGLTNGY